MQLPEIIKVFQIPNKKKPSKKMLSEKEKWQVDVEQEVIREIKLAPSLEYKDVIEVTGICLSRDGAYGISMQLTKDYFDLAEELEILPHESFGVSVFPELYVIKNEDDFDDIFL